MKYGTDLLDFDIRGYHIDEAAELRQKGRSSQDYVKVGRAPGHFVDALAPGKSTFLSHPLK